MLQEQHSRNYIFQTWKNATANNKGSENKFRRNYLMEFFVWALKKYHSKRNMLKMELKFGIKMWLKGYFEN